MNCGCVKNIGCFLPGQIIDFGIEAMCETEYTFEIFGVSGVTYISYEFEEGDNLNIPFNFNENSETIIKIQVPKCLQQPGFNYYTSPDGACSFAVNGMIPSGCPSIIY
jgi:hypothetical protein